MTARRLLLLKAMARTICGVLLPAALIILVNSGISEAQQAVAAAAAPSLLAAQSSGQQTSLSMTGCRATGDRTAITFVDQHHNIWYRATKKGLNLTDSNKKVYVIGGLLPTWNLAAQAGSEGGTAPGNTMTAIAWTLPNEQLGASPYPAPKVRIAWVPALNAACQTP